MTTDDSCPHDIHYEAAVAQLEQIIQTMEKGDLPLEASLAAYKKGVELLTYCQRKLADAEQQLQILDGETLKKLDLSDG